MGGGEGYMKVNGGGGVGFLKVNEGGANDNLSPKKMFRTMFVWLQLLGPLDSKVGSHKMKCQIS